MKRSCHAFKQLLLSQHLGLHFLRGFSTHLGNYFNIKSSMPYSKQIQFLQATVINLRQVRSGFHVQRRLMETTNLFFSVPSRATQLSFQGVYYVIFFFQLRLQFTDLTLRRCCGKRNHRLWFFSESKLLRTV